MEADRIAGAETADETAHVVWVPQAEGGVPGEFLDPRQGIRPLGERLNHEPLVDDQGVVAPACKKRLEEGFPPGRPAGDQQPERADHVGHVVPQTALRLAERSGIRVVELHQIVEAQVPKPAPANRLGRQPIVARPLLSEIAVQQFAPQTRRDHLLQPLARPVYPFDIHLFHLLPEIDLGRKRQDLGRQRRVCIPVLQRCTKCLEIVPGGVQPRLRHHPHQQPLAERLGRIPAIEAVGLSRHEEDQFIIAVVVGDLDRGGEAAQEGGNGLRCDTLEPEHLPWFAKFQHPRPVRHPGRPF